MEETPLTQLVSTGDALAAVKTLLGQHVSLLDYDVTPATSSVQGFLSLILRVTVRAETEDGEHVTTSFIVKRLPIMKEQLELIEGSDFFDREIQYFKKALPLLREKNSNLPIVKCIAAYDNMLILEDLCTSGFQTVSANMKDVGNSLQISHVRLAIRKLAEMHAASLDVDWLQELPFLTTDGLFEGHGRKMMESTIELGCKSIVEILKQFYPDLDEKYRQWLSTNGYEKITPYFKPSDKYLNVLCHGDFWENNMMFQLDSETKKPLAIKFIDLQLIRYASITTDLFYFLFLCTDKKFRDEYETDILETYVAAFNSAVCETPDRITIAELRREWDEGKLYGALLGATIKPMLLMETVMPGDQETMTKEQLNQVMFGVQPEAVMLEFRRNENFQSAMRELIDEVITEIDKARVV